MAAGKPPRRGNVARGTGRQMPPPRKSPRQTSPSPQPASAAETGWVGELSEDRSSWRNRSTPLRLRDAPFSLLLPSLVMAGIAFPVLLFTELLITVTAWIKGIAYTPFAMWAEPEMLFFLASIPGMGMVFGAWLLTRADFSCFEFDAQARVLRYQRRRLGRPLRMEEVPFEAILSVRPELMQSYAVDGHFEVRVRRPGQAGDLSLWLGDRLPIAQMRTHAAWLRTVLDDAVQSTLQHDA